MEQQELDNLVREFAHENNVAVELCRPVPKTELVNGISYKGICRNTDEAIWDVDAFIYTRYKFGTSYVEAINHYEDDDGYDVFVPIEIIRL